MTLPTSLEGIPTGAGQCLQETSLKKAIQEEVRNEIRTMLTEGSKLRYLVGWDQKRGPQMAMTVTWTFISLLHFSIFA